MPQTGERDIHIWFNSARVMQADSSPVGLDDASMTQTSGSILCIHTHTHMLMHSVCSQVLYVLGHWQEHHDDIIGM